jgi:hypothetical protein
MWLRPSEYSTEQLAYLAALGRALALAQNFEHNCQFVFGTWDMIHAFESGKPIEERRALGKKLQRRFLGASLQAQRHDDILTAENYAKLEAAVAARNFLAHEASMAGQYVPPHNGRPGGTKKLKALLNGTLTRTDIERERENMLNSHLGEAVDRLADAVDRLAQADLLVAVWSHLIEEKEEHVPSFVVTYIRDARDWVNEPLRLAGLLLGPCS